MAERQDDCAFFVHEKKRPTCHAVKGRPLGAKLIQTLYLMRSLDMRTHIYIFAYTDSFCLSSEIFSQSSADGTAIQEVLLAWYFQNFYSVLRVRQPPAIPLRQELEILNHRLQPDGRVEVHLRETVGAGRDAWVSP